MSGFEVKTAELRSASAMVGSGACDFDGARSAVAGSSADLAGTPAQGAYGGLVEAASAMLDTLTEAADRMSEALAKAAVTYDICEQAVARSASQGGR